jgi:long-chain acyl-CoA synthetase
VVGRGTFLDVIFHWCLSLSYIGLSLLDVCSTTLFRPRPLFSILQKTVSSSRLSTQCVPLYSGTSLFFAESLKTFATDLQRCRPTLFLSVPRLWTKFQVAVNAKLPPKKLNMLLKIPIISMIVKKKVVKTLGLDQCRFAGSGSAPLPQELLEWYRKMGLELLEGYGMTENFNYSHLSMPGKVRVGYVGNCYKECECRIAQDGEIQVKTPGKMMGYYKNEEATKEALTDDGWVRTGDKGSLDQEKRLKITGRTKEIFKTSKGKYVAPAPIENLFIPHPHVELACVSGKGQPQPHIVIQLSENIKLEAAKGATEREAIGKELENHMVNVVNPTLDPHEQLQFLVIVKDDWIPENGFLTPTQKIRRNVIEDAYGPNDAAWYGKKEKVIWHGW